VYRVSLTATAGTERDQEARAFPVNWMLDGGASGPLVGGSSTGSGNGNGSTLHGAGGVTASGTPGTVANVPGSGDGSTGSDSGATGGTTTGGPSTGSGQGAHDNGWHNGANPNGFVISHDDKSQGQGNNHH
jgi:hypothetical protein